MQPCCSAALLAAHEQPGLIAQQAFSSTKAASGWAGVVSSMLTGLLGTLEIPAALRSHGPGPLAVIHLMHIALNFGVRARIVQLCLDHGFQASLQAVAMTMTGRCTFLPARAPLPRWLICTVC